MTTVNVCTVNVLFEEYYRRYCKAAYVVPLEERTRLFCGWLERTLPGVDVVAMQEFPYGSAHASWMALVAEIAHRHGHNVVAHEACRNDGLLFLVRNTLAVRSTSSVLFSKAAGNKGSKRMMNVVLESNSGAVFGVINAHVPWAPRFAQGCFNTRELFSQIQPDIKNWVAVGDWNLCVPVQCREQFRRECLPEGWVDVTEALDTTTCAGDRGFSKIDYITMSPSVTLAGTVQCEPPSPHNNVLHCVPEGLDARNVQWFSDHSAVCASLVMM